MKLSDYVHEPFENPHCPKCSCNKTKNKAKAALISPNNPASCYNANKWITKVKLPINPNGVYMQLLNISYDLQIDPQLQLDVSRTYNSNIYFANEGKKVLERVLHTLSAYCPNLGYVQGMNYLVGALLWHCNEVDCFWLFIGLLEDFELRDNFLSGFPGLKKHFHVLEYLINHYHPAAFRQFLNLGFNIEFFSTDWLLTLFCNTTPVELSTHILNKFFKYGWNFIYKLCLEITGRLEMKIVECSRLSEIIYLFKPNEGKGWKGFIKSLEKNRENINWKKLLKTANSLCIDEWFLNCMKHNSRNIAENH